MSSEFDDLFATGEIQFSKSMRESRAILSESEQLLDDGNYDQLAKVFAGKSTGTMAKQAATVPAFNPTADPLEKLMNESNPTGGHELTKNAPETSRHFDEVIRIVSRARNAPAISKYKNVPGIREAWADLALEALDFIEAQV